MTLPTPSFSSLCACLSLPRSLFTMSRSSFSFPASQSVSSLSRRPVPLPVLRFVGQRRRPPASQHARHTSIITSATCSTAAMADPAPLLVVSLGNPPPYANTLHSAGHLLLPAVAQALAPGAPPLGAHAQYRGGRAAADPGAGPHAFFQPAAHMNELGPSVAAAWRAFRRGLASAAASERARLVLLHDELELPLGRVRRRPGASSPKGHNGLRSVAQALGGATAPVVRVGVGIGRPDSRDPAAVSAYVLRKVAPRERVALDAAVDDVIDILRELEAGEGGGKGTGGRGSKTSPRRS